MTQQFPPPRCQASPSSGQVSEPGLAGFGHHVAAPEALSGLHVVGVEVAARPELPAGTPYDDLVLHDEGSDRGALTGPHVTMHGVPDLLAALGVERDHVGVQGGEEDLPVRHGDPAVHVAAAQRDIERDRMLVLPQRLPRRGVEAPEKAIPARDEHDAVHDERGGLERVRRRTRVKALAAGLEHKRGGEALDVVLVDLVQQAEPLPVVGAVVGDPVMRFSFAGIEDALVRDVLRYRRRITRSRRSNSRERRAAVRLCILASTDSPFPTGRGYGRGCGGRSSLASSGTSPNTTIAPIRPRPSSLPTLELYQ